MTNPNSPAVEVLGWEAWSPQLDEKAKWLAWLPEAGPLPDGNAKPACQGVSPLLRRRFSLTTRMMLETSLELCRQSGVTPNQTHLLFGSANGEIATLKGLLNDLSQASPLSPTAFSNSVHHVPTGHFGMVAQHKTISRTISSYKDTFACLWLEAMCLLRRHPQLPVLMTLADENTPVPFDRLLVGPPFPFAVTLLLRAGSANAAESLTFAPADKAFQATPRLTEEPSFDFLRWFVSSDPAFHLETAFGGVTWTR